MIGWKEIKYQVNRSLARKLTLGFLIIASLEAAILGAVSLRSLHQLTAINRQLEEISLSLEATRNLSSKLAQVPQPINEFLLRGDHSLTSERFRSAIAGIKASLLSCSSATCHGATKRPREMAASLSPVIVHIQEKGMAVFEGEKSREELGNLATEAGALALEAVGLMDRMSAVLSQRIKVLRAESARVGQRAVLLFIIFALSSLALAAAATSAMARRVTVPVRRLLLGTRRIMEGDLDYRVEVDVHDEVGDLAESFNAMVQTLKEYKDRIDDYNRSLEEKVRERSEQLKKAQESLLRSEKLASIGLLASGVAHELNNPLTSILMNVNLLMESIDEKSELYKELRQIGEDSLRCKRIIDDLRDFSRHHELNVRPSDLNQVVRNTLKLIEHELELHAIALRQELSSELPLVGCDPDRLQQVLMNVLINAIQAMPEGGILMVSTALREGSVEIAVRDSGPGIPKEIRGRIFDPFFTTKQGGTGLGLSIAYRIMEEHGGRITVESLTADEVKAEASGSVGTTIRLFLPLGT